MQRDDDLELDFGLIEGMEAFVGDGRGKGGDSTRCSCSSGILEENPCQCNSSFAPDRSSLLLPKRCEKSRERREFRTGGKNSRKSEVTRYAVLTHSWPPVKLEPPTGLELARTVKCPLLSPLDSLAIHCLGIRCAHGMSLYVRRCH